MSTGEVVWCETQATTRNTDTVHRIEWTLLEFSKIPLEKNVAGPGFYLTPGCLVSMSLKKKENELFLFIKSEAPIQFVRSDASFSDRNGQTVHSFSPNTAFKLVSSQERDMIESVKEFYEHLNTLTDDTLVFRCSLRFTDTLTTEMQPFAFRGSSKLINDLKTIREHPVDCDVSLRVGEDSVPAYRYILCARSPRFRKMFVDEGLEGDVRIWDFPLSTVQALVGFLHAGVLQGGTTLNGVYDLYRAALEYEVSDLRAICREKLKSRCNVGSVIQILLWADRHSDEELLHHALRFIKSNYAAVRNSISWRELLSAKTHLHLVVYVLGLDS